MLALFVLGLTMNIIICGVSDDPQQYLSGPICLEDVLIFECSVTGGTYTVWRGTAFDCSNSNNEIALLHSRFNSSTALGLCNNEAVVGQGLYDEDGQYTSQLNVTVKSTLKGKIIECISDINGTIEEIIGHFTLGINDLMCANYNDVKNKGNSFVNNIIAAAVVVTMGFVIIAAGIVFGIVKKLLTHKISFTLEQELRDLRLPEVEASASLTVMGTKGDICDDKRLCPADFDHNLSTMTSAECLPACKNDECKLDSEDEERLDLDSLLMKLRGTVDAKLWYQFGMTLGVPRDTLENISSYDDEQCLIEVADYWLRNHPTKPTWSEICDDTKRFKPMNDHTVIITQDIPGSVMKGACPPNSIILNYTAVIPKSLRSRLQRSTSPPPIPPRMEQQPSTQSSAVPPRPPKP